MILLYIATLHVTMYYTLTALSAHVFHVMATSLKVAKPLTVN